MTFIATGSMDTDIGGRELEDLVASALARSGTIRNAVALPPDHTRQHSMAGPITDHVARILGPALGAVLPALGSHSPMSEAGIAGMFPGTPRQLFRVHDWRTGVTELGRIEEEFVETVSGGLLRYEWPAQANRLLVEGGFDRIVSIGQVVPHEVVGMANHAKNIFVGTGGKDGIDKSHFLGAVYGMERMMGRTDTPVRRLFDEAMLRFGNRMPPVLWILTVVGRRDDGGLAIRGLYAGDDRECFERAAALSRAVNLDLLERPIRKAVVWLDPSEFRTTWLGNKAIYRLRMAMANGGELLVLAPGLEGFGEDAGIDALIRRYGYRSGTTIRDLVARHPDLGDSLSAAAHLVHGCPEGRFTVTYAPGPGVSKTELEGVGFGWADLAKVTELYLRNRPSAGWNRTVGGEDYFYVPNPALGLWSLASRFMEG